MTFKTFGNGIQETTFDGKRPRKGSLKNNTLATTETKGKNLGSQPSEARNYGSVWNSVDQSFVERIYSKIKNKWSEPKWVAQGVTANFYNPALDRNEQIYIDNIVWNTYWHDITGHVEKQDIIDNYTDYEVRTYVYTDTWYEQDVQPLQSDGTYNAEFFHNLNTGTKDEVDYSVRLYKTTNDTLIDAEAPFIDRKNIFNGKVSGITLNDYEPILFDFTDQYYEKEVGQFDSTGHFGFFINPSDFNGSYVIRIEPLDSSKEIVMEYHEKSNLVKSYDVPIGFTQDGADLYNILGKRCFIYDQAIALCAAVSMEDYAQAEIYLDGLLNTQHSNGNWAFSYGTISSTAPDPYYRSGASFWCGYALLFALDNMTNLSSTKRSTVETAVTDFLNHMETEFWVDDTSRTQHHTFTGGKGKYESDYEARVDVESLDGTTQYVHLTDYGFDFTNGTITPWSGGSMGENTTYKITYDYYDPHPDRYTITDEEFTTGTYGTAINLSQNDVVDDFDERHIVPWTSTEHNIDAYEVYTLASSYFSDSHYTNIKNNLESSLFDKIWIEDENKAARGLRNSVDDCHALDVGSWYSIAAMSAGLPERQKNAMEIVKKYEVKISNDTGEKVRGFKPYHPEFCYPEAKELIWYEGTWGVILAYLALGEKRKAAFYVRESLKFELEGGWPYTTEIQESYEMQSWTSFASTGWFILATRPNGFWGVTESLVEGW